MSFFVFDTPTGGPGNGIFPGTGIRTCTMRGGAAVKGQIVRLCTRGLLDDAAVTSVTPGDAASTFANVQTPDGLTREEGLGGYVLGVALDAIADDAEGEILFYGITDVLTIISAGGSTVVGQLLWYDEATTPTGLEGDALAVGDKTRVIYGISQEITAVTTLALTSVWFNGFAGTFTGTSECIT